LAHGGLVEVKIMKGTNMLASLKLSYRLWKRKISRKRISDEHRKAYWRGRRRIWNNDLHKKMKAEYNG
jgi:hypothetical protein